MADGVCRGRGRFSVLEGLKFFDLDKVLAEGSLEVVVVVGGLLEH